ncbi:hypothetical protein ABPG77_003306 [Micractinium sp. CCAP 211/92]
MRAALLAILLCLAGPVAAVRLYANFTSRQAARTAAVTLARMNPEGRRAMFMQWKADTGKSYTTLDQESRHFRTWTVALNDMVRHNLLPSATWFRGLNRFSDMPWEQFKAERLMEDASVAAALEKTKDAPLHEVGGERPPAAWDWRAEEVTGAVRDQGQCGAGWAHAAVAALEAAAVLDEAAPAGALDLSEQQMLDCLRPETGYASRGCKAGHADEVFRHAAARFIVPEALIPYTGQDGGACTAPSEAPPGAVRAYSPHGFVRVGDGAAALMDAVASQGPVVAYLNVLAEMVAYTSGVYQPGQCATDTYNHAMVVVGYNATAGVGAPGSYWLLRNSWGADWGEEGHIRVQMLADAPGGCRLFSGLMYSASTIDQQEPAPSPAAGQPAGELQPPPAPQPAAQQTAEPSSAGEQPAQPLQPPQPTPQPPQSTPQPPQPTPQQPHPTPQQPHPPPRPPARPSSEAPLLPALEQRAPLQPPAHSMQLPPPQPNAQELPPAGRQPAAEAQPPSAGNSQPLPPQPSPQPPATDGLPAQQPLPPLAPQSPVPGHPPGRHAQQGPPSGPAPTQEPTAAPPPAPQPPSQQQQPPSLQQESAPSTKLPPEPVPSQAAQQTLPPLPAPAPSPEQATSRPSPPLAQAEPTLSQPADPPSPAPSPPALPPPPPPSTPQPLPPSRRLLPPVALPPPPAPSPAHTQPTIQPPILQPSPAPPSPLPQPASPDPPLPPPPSPTPTRASDAPPRSLPATSVHGSPLTPLGASTCANGICPLPLHSPYLGISSLAFAAYSSAFPVTLVAQAAGAPLRYQKLQPPLTGWIKYIGPGGADALLLTGGQEADGWTTQLTGRAALDGVQSRHRMLRRVRLVRGPAVVTVLAQEARPGGWQLRVCTGYTMRPVGTEQTIRLAGGVTVQTVPPSPDGQQPASFVVHAPALRLEGALRGKAAPAPYGAWLDVAVATGGPDLQLLPKPLAGLLANV